MYLESRAAAFIAVSIYIYNIRSPKVDSIHYHNCLVHHCNYSSSNVASAVSAHTRL
jgi:hypothetical protein